MCISFQEMRNSRHVGHIYTCIYMYMLGHDIMFAYSHLCMCVHMSLQATYTTHHMYTHVHGFGVYTHDGSDVYTRMSHVTHIDVYTHDVSDVYTHTYMYAHAVKYVFTCVYVCVYTYLQGDIFDIYCHTHIRS